MAKGQSERLMTMLEDVLADAGLDWDRLDAIGVGTGPGNFTGIRISVAAARGLSLGLGIPAVGVSLLDALAVGASGPTLACLDARHGAGYFQRFGYGDPAPFVAAIADLKEEAVGVTCVGDIADDIAHHIGAKQAPAAYAPASAIARLACQRFGGQVERPAPCYLRAADAAPSRERPPVLLA